MVPSSFRVTLIRAGLGLVLFAVVGQAAATERRLSILNRTNSGIAGVLVSRVGDDIKFAKKVSQDHIDAASRAIVTINDVYDSCSFQVVLDFEFGADVTKSINLCAKQPMIVVTSSDRL